MKGSALALIIFCALVLFINEDFSLKTLFSSLLPGVVLLSFSLLLIKNYELDKKIKS